MPHVQHAALLVLGLSSAAHAYFLDASRNFDFRARLY
jgi:hypothetical protein